jgi:hypothetical protein
MARQLMSKKNVNKYAKKYDLPIVHILVRGNTKHRKDLCLKDRSIVYLFNDGTMEKADSILKWSESLNEIQ